MNIVTGYRGEAHVTSAQFQSLNRSIIGQDSYVSNEGSKMAATLISANEVRIADGTLFLQGIQAEIPVNTYEAVSISNGAQGMSRKDIIAARYTKDASTSVEGVSLVVIEGEPSSGIATAPAVTEGDIREGALVADFPLYQVSLVDVSVTAVDRLFGYVSDIGDLVEDLSTVQSGLNSVNSWQTGNLFLKSIVVADNVSISHGEAKNITWNSTSVPTTSDGRTIVSRVPVQVSISNASSSGSGSSVCLASSVTSSGCYVRNMHDSSTAKVKVTCCFLYQKTV